MDILLRVKNLNIDFDGEKVIENLSFEVKEGETLVILGPNGAGKTVLLKGLLGLLPYKGEIEWKSNIKIGYVPQGLPRAKDLPLTVEEFLRFKTKNKKEIFEALKLVGLKDLLILEKQLGILSSGQFQRILIAWSLIGHPQVLLFDEPTAGIDIGGEETIYSLLRKIQEKEKLTILLATHELNIVYKYATNVLCLNKRKLCFGPPREILSPERLSQVYGQEIKFYTHKH